MDKKKLIAAAVALVIGVIAGITQIDFKSAICSAGNAADSQVGK